MLSSYPVSGSDDGYLEVGQRSSHLQIRYIYRAIPLVQVFFFCTIIEFPSILLSTFPRILHLNMDSKEVKDSGLYDDVHVGQPDYPDYTDANVESYDGEHVNTGHTALKRQLKSRHIAMISIGGVIGTGLFLGTANSLKNGGPLGLLMGYLAIGSVCYCVMVSFEAAQVVPRRCLIHLLSSV